MLVIRRGCPWEPIAILNTYMLTNLLDTLQTLSVVKAGVGKIPRVPYVSTETIAHGTLSCDLGSTRGTDA